MQQVVEGTYFDGPSYSYATYEDASNTLATTHACPRKLKRGEVIAQGLVTTGPGRDGFATDTVRIVRFSLEDGRGRYLGTRAAQGSPALLFEERDDDMVETFLLRPGTGAPVARTSEYDHGRYRSTTTYSGFAHWPLNARTRTLLRMSPHPGVRRVREPCMK